jgi:uncharacterized membrane protein
LGRTGGRQPEHVERRPVRLSQDLRRVRHTAPHDEPHVINLLLENIMFGLTNLGLIHTAISVVALVAGAVALVRDREISARNGLGQIYLWTTVITCVTGFGIFQHGGFGKPHMLGVLTLLALGAAAVAERTGLLGRVSAYVATLSYSLTFFLHFIPGVTETLTRLPAGHPVFSSPEDPKMQPVMGGIFLLFLIGATLQVIRLRGGRKPAASVRVV